MARSLILRFLGCLAAMGLGGPVDAFDYEDLIELISREQLTSIEQVIPRLPKEYLENYTLVFDSRSLHGSSYDHPRAILFGRGARLIITFNGDFGQDRFHELEAIQYRESSARFEMRSISFDRGVRFSDANPPVCLSCHGSDPRPIWSSYEYSEIEPVKHWPGAYGATHDAPSMDAEEGAAYLRFRERAVDHPRYGALRLDHPRSSWFPFGSGPHAHEFRPNNRLGNLLARLNARRLARDLMGKPFFGRYPAVSLSWLLRCPHAEDERYLEFVKRVYDRKFSGLLDLALDGYADKSVEQVAFVFEKLLSGLDVYTWNLTAEPRPDDDRFFTGIVDIDELVAAAVLAELPSDHWLRTYYVPWGQRQLYDTFSEGYYRSNVAPGGVGEVYEQLGPFYDRQRMQMACPRLRKEALEEMTQDPQSSTRVRRLQLQTG